MRVIKKYKNRIMYDTETSKPVTLSQLADMIRNNVAVKILDNTSGKDITRLTILQILLDLEKSGKGIRHFIPEILSWLFETSKQEYSKALTDICQGNALDINFGQTWAKRLVEEGIKANVIESENKDFMVQELSVRLSELYLDILKHIEITINERLDAIDKMIGGITDSHDSSIFRLSKKSKI